MALAQSTQQAMLTQTRKAAAPKAAAMRPAGRTQSVGAARRVAGSSNPTWVARAGATAVAPAKTEQFSTQNRDEYFTRRHEVVQRYFPTSLGVEDFGSRVEIALSAFGFNGNNSIGEWPARMRGSGS
jgi:hypothetical protein